MFNPPRTRLATATRLIHIKDTPPGFLAPILESRTILWKQKSLFSTSVPFQTRKRDNNPNRGVSALRRTGLRYPLGMSKEPLPVPVLDPKKRSKVTVDENHGLWGFFNAKRTPLSTPEEDAACGNLAFMYDDFIYANILKVDHGRFRSYGTSLGKTCTRFGGCV